MLCTSNLVKGFLIADVYFPDDPARCVKLPDEMVMLLRPPSIIGKLREAMAGVAVYVSGRKRLQRTLKALLRRRAAIEPVIAHLKQEHKMGRNHLLG